MRVSTKTQHLRVNSRIPGIQYVNRRTRCTGCGVVWRWREYRNFKHAEWNYCFECACEHWIKESQGRAIY